MKTLTTLVLAACLTLPAFSDDKDDAEKKPDHAKMQKEAPEHLVLEITSARRQRLNTRNGFYFSWNVRGRIVEVKRSETNLQEGTIVAFRYRLPDTSVNNVEGDYPPVVEIGNSYEAFLQLGSDGRQLYIPAAGSKTFIPLQTKEELEAEAAKAEAEARKNLPAVRRLRPE